jgi:hypothetical protein
MQHDPAQDLVSAPLKESNLTVPVEMVTISLAKAGQGGVISVEWGTMKVTANFTAQ